MSSPATDSTAATTPPAESESAGLTYADVANHTKKEDLYVVIHDRVYNVTEFVDEHPGGEEVMLDVAGQDATEAFEDVGHSDEARTTLEQLYVAPLKRVRKEQQINGGMNETQKGDPAPKSRPPAKTSTGTEYDSGTGMATGLGIGLYAAIVVAGAAAWYTWRTLSSQEE
ncbi:MAG: hypothetical protein M1838_003585 [Thelocarpon superellum]|nr:MAG: hypothetical protein M1838_003585 [Thelocarpon superellum]